MWPQKWRHFFSFSSMISRGSRDRPIRMPRDEKHVVWFCQVSWPLGVIRVIFVEHPKHFSIIEFTSVHGHSRHHFGVLLDSIKANDSLQKNSSSHFFIMNSFRPFTLGLCSFGLNCEYPSAVISKRTVHMFSGEYFEIDSSSFQDVGQTWSCCQTWFQSFPSTRTDRSTQCSYG